jgi:hypothetical protein
MSPESTRRFADRSASQQRFLSLFLRSEREIFRYVAVLVPNVADAEDIVQQAAVALWEKFDAYDPTQPFTPWACRFVTVIGADPRDHQIITGPPVLTLDKFGMWLHLAVVIDGPGKQVIQYLNGVSVSTKPLKIGPPFRVGAAELGNWNAKGFPEDDPFMIRNFSGAMDEFCLFSRALKPAEIRALYSQGKPQPDSLVQNSN